MSTGADSPLVPADPQPPAAPRSVRGRARTVAVGALGVVAVFSLFLSTAAVWVHTVLFDTDRVAESVGDSLSRPEVSEGLADFVTEQIFQLVNLEDRYGDIVPDRLEVFVPMIRESAEKRVSDRIQDVITSDRGHDLIVAAARRTHRAALAALEGDVLPDGVDVQDDTLSINLLPLLFRGLDAIAEKDLLPKTLLPELTPEGSIAGQIRQLEVAFRVDLPDDFGQFVLYEGDKVTKSQELVDLARRSLTIFNRATVAVVLLTFVSGASAIGFARRRLRAVGLLAAGSALALILQRVLVEQVVDQSSTLLLDPAARALISALVTALTSNLLTAITVIVVLSVAAVIVTSAVGSLAKRQPPTAAEAT